MNFFSAQNCFCQAKKNEKKTSAHKKETHFINIKFVKQSNSSTNLLTLNSEFVFVFYHLQYITNKFVV